jgi:uncharacterized sulfatase
MTNEAPRERPDILFLVLDTLRADRLSCYGHPTETSPTLDAFAETGTRFERAISPAQWTIPAHGSLFSGEYPTTHGTTQITHKHAAAHPTLAEQLDRAGYHTVGFCNNPLLGVVDNGLDRGFREFYNYGGVLPARPTAVQGRIGWLGALIRPLRKLIGRLNEPIQALFTQREWLLNLAMQPRLVALWERHINFKGNTERSLRDLLGYLRYHHRREAREPLFVYLNLMETHLPYEPPKPFIRKHAPHVLEDPEARDFMERYNRRSYDWITPILTPFSELEHETLNAMYNAEVAYEDHLLRPLLRYLNEPEIRDNTLVILTSDHGEGLDHHGYVGHSLVTYEDLIRVPLILRDPAHYPAGTTVEAPISTRRLYHTVLEAAGCAADEETEQLSLRRTVTPTAGEPAPDEPVWSEAVAPLTMVKLMEKQNPEAIERFRCRDTRRALYEGVKKLITVGDEPEELFDVGADPAEVENRITAEPALAAQLNERLDAAVAAARSRRWDRAGDDVDLSGRSQLSERLRRLGYVE